MTESTIQVFFSAATLFGILAYVIHAVYTGYKEHKKIVFQKLYDLDKKKTDEEDCKEWRRLEEKNMDELKGSIERRRMKR
jgi:hypothetical protein